MALTTVVPELTLFIPMLSSFSSRASSRTGLNCFSKVGFRLRASSTLRCPSRDSSSSAAEDNHQGHPKLPLPKPHCSHLAFTWSTACELGATLSTHPWVKSWVLSASGHHRLRPSHLPYSGFSFPASLDL